MQRFSVKLALAVVCLMVSSLHADQAATEQLYKSKCAMCHGADGKGQTAAGKSMGARSFSSPEVQKESQEELSNIISKGKSKMPGYAGKLKDSEIIDLAGYVRALGNK